MNVLVCAGEASGDAYGADLIREMKAAATESHVYYAVGGVRLKASGAQLIADSSTWGVISITQSLRAYPRIALSYFRIRQFIQNTPPGLFIPIDFGFANIRLAKLAKAKGWKVLYFIPPGSWRRDKQGADLPAVTDAIVTPFPWSAEILNRMGANAHFFGHPIKQALRGSLAADTAIPFPADGKTFRLAVLPGSRNHEIAEHVPIVAKTLPLLNQPNMEVTFALAPGADVDAFRRRWESLTGRTGDTIAVGRASQVLRSASAAIVCSGTATLEAALCRVPLVLIYEISPVMKVEAKIIGFKRPKFIGLPNILLDREIVPEMVEENASPEKIAAAIRAVVSDGGVQQAAFDELEHLLGPEDAITQTAAFALQLMKVSP